MESPPPPERSFNRGFLRTWTLVFKVTEMVLCLLTFLCNELAWFPFVPYPARTFLSVCACVSLITTGVLFLTLGFSMDKAYSSSTWWRYMVFLYPGGCSLFLMMASAAQLNIGGRADAGFQAAATFGFLAFSTYLADALYQFSRLRQVCQLPTSGVRLQSVISDRINRLTKKGDRPGEHRAESEDSDRSTPSRTAFDASVAAPAASESRHFGQPDAWSLDSDQMQEGTYSTVRLEGN